MSNLERLRRGMQRGGPQDGWQRTVGARVVEVESGSVVVELDVHPGHHHGGGVVQGGIITQLADAGFELKTNLIEPGRIGEALVAVAEVLYTGRRTGVAECRVEAEGDRLLARATATFIVHLPESQS